MTHENAGGHQIHIRLDGGGPGDLESLHRWLSREDWFVHAERQYGLRVAYREDDGTEPAPGPDGPQMGGLITELVLVVTSAAMTPVFEDLYTRAKAAVSAWADNSGAEPPRVDRTDSTGGTGGTDDGTEDGEGGRIR